MCYFLSSKKFRKRRGLETPEPSLGRFFYPSPVSTNRKRVRGHLFHSPVSRHPDHPSKSPTSTWVSSVQEYPPPPVSTLVELRRTTPKDRSTHPHQTFLRGRSCDVPGGVPVPRVHGDTQESPGHGKRDPGRDCPRGTVRDTGGNG